MSNRPTLQITKFVNMNPDGSESGDVSYGVRLYDDYEQKYDNTMEKSDLPSTPEEALELIQQMAEDMYEFIVSEKGGFYFGDEWVQVDGEGNIVAE